MSNGEPSQEGLGQSSTDVADILAATNMESSALRRLGEKAVHVLKHWGKGPILTVAVLGAIIGSACGNTEAPIIYKDYPGPFPITVSAGQEQQPFIVAPAYSLPTEDAMEKAQEKEEIRPQGSRSSEAMRALEKDKESSGEYFIPVRSPDGRTNQYIFPKELPINDASNPEMHHFLVMDPAEGFRTVAITGEEDMICFNEVTKDMWLKNTFGLGSDRIRGSSLYFSADGRLSYRGWGTKPIGSENTDLRLNKMDPDTRSEVVREAILGSRASFGKNQGNMSSGDRANRLTDKTIFSMIGSLLSAPPAK